MAFLLCRRTGTGPNCKDLRLETAEPEKADCIKKAMLECIADVWDCRVGIYGSYRQAEHNATDSPMGDQECYSYTCIDKLLKCYCAPGLSGLTCSLCDADMNGVMVGPKPPDAEEEEEEPEAALPGASPQRLTLSSTEAYIPLLYGTVRVTGNIIWSSTARSVSITKTYNAGGTTYTYSVDVRAVDLMVGLCEGVVDGATKVWFGPENVYDSTAKTGPAINPDQAENGVTFRFYKGTESQKVNKKLANAVGFGRAPANRGLAYMMINGYPATQAGNGSPDFRIEVSRTVVAGAATHAESTESTYEAQSIAIDPPSGRFAIAKTSGFDVVSSSDLLPLTSLSDTVNPETLTMDALNGGLFYQTTTGTLKYVSPLSYDFTASLAAPSLSVDQLAMYTFVSPTHGKVSAVLLSDDEDLYLYRAKHEDHTLALAATFTGASLGISTPYKFVTIADYVLSGSTSPDVRGYAINQDASKDVHFLHYLFYNPGGSVTYAENRSFTHLVYDPKDLGCRTSSATLVSVVELGENSQFVLFFQEGSTYTATCVEHGSLNDPVWTKTFLTAAPTGKLTRRVGGSLYKYIVGNALYSMDLDTGEVVREYTLSANGAFPIASGSSQHYDSVKNAVMYITTTGELAAIYPDRLAASGTSLRAVTQELLSRGGLDNDMYDMSALAAITVNGYLVETQPRLGDALAELGEYYAFLSYESSGKIKALPLSAMSLTTVDDDLSMTPTVMKNQLDLTDLHYVSVGYFDESRDFTAYTQRVSMDMLRGVDGEEAFEGFEYSLNMYTNSNEARRSAEVSLNRRVQNSRAFKTHLPPRYLALEPVDFILSTDIKTRISKVSMGGSFSSEIVSYEDDESIYENLTALNGVVLNPINNTTTDSTVVRSKLLAVQGPYPGDSFQSVLWLGQVAPDYDTFTPYTMRAASPVSVSQRVDAVTSEALIGKLTSVPTTLGVSMATQWDGTFTVVFTKDVDPAKFPTADVTELYASYTKNLLLVGRELIQFLSASVGLDNRTVTFTGLLRGRFGTDQIANTHATGELVVLYEDNSISFLEVGSTGVSLKQASGYMYNAATQRYFSADVGYLYSHLADPKQPWSSVYTTVKKITTGGFASQRGVFFRAGIRRHYSNTLPDTLPPISSAIGQSSVFLYILKAPYDEALFMAKVLEDNYPKAGETSAGSNSYIRRRIPMAMNSYTMYQAGTQYSESLLFNDTFSYTSDLHAAIAVHYGVETATTNPSLPIVGRPTGIKIEGTANYLSYKQVIEYN